MAALRAWWGPCVDTQELVTFSLAYGPIRRWDILPETQAKCPDGRELTAEMALSGVLEGPPGLPVAAAHHVLLPAPNIYPLICLTPEAWRRLGTHWRGLQVLGRVSRMAQQRGDGGRR